MDLGTICSYLTRFHVIIICVNVTTYSSLDLKFLKGMAPNYLLDGSGIYELREENIRYK